MRLLLILSVLLTSIVPLYETSFVYAEKEIPPHARWGKVVMQKAKERYPGAEIVDYLHVGRVKEDKNTSIEKFKLWIKGKDHEFGVFVNVTYATETDQIIDISFKEVNN
ncbi:DUF3889 domain-containing protein [Virgibacillus sp. DJP39]|uniref:DUF3889 domain-containing protein n=1 Tax=Virgibacillus sp. DJP39 TaxID=3409790 RepID=UPI003BB6462D